MKQGITIERTCDLHDRPIVRITKRRGRLSVEEVDDLLRHEGFGEWWGHYAIVLNCTESTIGGNGLFDFDEPKGDTLDLYKIDEGEECPVCGQFTPPYVYCPNCGSKWSDIDQNAETLLASMRGETERSIREAKTQAGAVAWYWTQIGAIDMARQLGLITEERRHQLYEEMKPLKPEEVQHE